MIGLLSCIRVGAHRPAEDQLDSLLLLLLPLASMMLWLLLVVPLQRLHMHWAEVATVGVEAGSK